MCSNNVYFSEGAGGKERKKEEICEMGSQVRARVVLFVFCGS